MSTRSSVRMYQRSYHIAFLVEYTNLARLFCLLKTARILCPESNYSASHAICLSLSLSLSGFVRTVFKTRGFGCNKDKEDIKHQQVIIRSRICCLSRTKKFSPVFVVAVSNLQSLLKSLPHDWYSDKHFTLVYDCHVVGTVCLLQSITPRPFPTNSHASLNDGYTF